MQHLHEIKPIAKDPLLEEEKLANAISDSISPLLVPEIELISYRGSCKTPVMLWIAIKLRIIMINFGVF